MSTLNNSDKMSKILKNIQDDNIFDWWDELADINYFVNLTYLILMLESLKLSHFVEFGGQTDWRRKYQVCVQKSTAGR